MVRRPRPRLWEAVRTADAVLVEGGLVLGVVGAPASLMWLPARSTSL